MFSYNDEHAKCLGTPVRTDVKQTDFGFPVRGRINGISDKVESWAPSFRFLLLFLLAAGMTH